MRIPALHAVLAVPAAQVQLDGTVRASGVGIPPWKQFVADLPELGSMRTKLSDGSL